MRDSGERGVVEIADRLVLLGLEPQEAEVYVRLTAIGPLRASEVARASSLARAAAYRVLDRLVERGFAAKTPERPARFAAVPPETLVSTLNREAQARVERIRAVGAATVEDLLRLRAQPGGPAPPNVFRVVRGRREVYGLMERLFWDAARDLRIANTHPLAGAMLDVGGLAEGLPAGGRGHLRVRLLVRPDALGERLQRLAGSEHVSVRAIETTSVLRCMIADDRELLLLVESDPEGGPGAPGDVALWTTSPELVDGYRFLFDSAWDGATVAAGRVATLGRLPAPEYGGLRVPRG